MVKDLAHSLLADDERLVADAMPPAWPGRRCGVGGWRAAGAEAGCGCGVGRRGRNGLQG